MLSMPRGTDPLTVQQAAREFAKIEFTDHHYVMVLHQHQANPHVHLSVKAESKHGLRLNPRKADLQRWRETFAERLRERGIDAEATRQATRGEVRNRGPLWRLRAQEQGRLPAQRPTAKAGTATRLSRNESLAAWKRIAMTLAHSDSLDDRKLARQIVDFVKEMPMLRKQSAHTRDVQRALVQPEPGSVQARHAASRVRWRRAAPALDSAWRAVKSVLRAVARAGPAVQVRPAAGQRTRAQSHRRWERAVGDPAVDRRAAQAGHLEHDGQAREHAWRVAGGG